jgi:hypothetical protein
MSFLLIDRLLLTFMNVKHRLETLLNLCRIYENLSSINDDECDEFYRFYGPYHSDIEELEESIVCISSLIENLQHEQDMAEDCQAFPNYPLCKNGWTFKDIEQLEEEPCLNLEILNQLSLHTLNEYDNQFDEQQQHLTRSLNVTIIHLQKFIHFLHRGYSAVREITNDSVQVRSRHAPSPGTSRESRARCSRSSVILGLDHSWVQSMRNIDQKE